MQQYVKTYLKYRGLSQFDIIYCEVCGSIAVDLHHILGRGKHTNDPKTIIPLCRRCHEATHKHNTNKTKDYLLSLIKKYEPIQ